MITIVHRVEQHTLEHESRLGRVDELQERDRLADQPGEMKQKSAEEWEQEALAQAGPMGVWDAVAQQLEKLLEKTGA